MKTDMALLVGSKLNGQTYTVTEVLGQGSFGITYRCETTLTVAGKLGSVDIATPFAVKEFFMNEVNSRIEGHLSSGCDTALFLYYHKKFHDEANKLAAMDHPGIVKVLDIFEENNTTYYVMEFISGGSLESVIRQVGCLNAPVALILVRKVAEALEYMHDRQMLHLDLKPANIMIKEDGEPVLIDFGLAKQYKDDKPETSTTIGLGTPGYSPLEQSVFQNGGKNFQPTIDVYALGATLFRMVTGCNPPESPVVLNCPDILDTVMEKCGVAPEIRPLVTSAMSPVVANRPQNMAEFISMVDACLLIILAGQQWDEEKTHTALTGLLSTQVAQSDAKDVSIEQSATDDRKTDPSVRMDNGLDSNIAIKTEVSVQNDCKSEVKSIEFRFGGANYFDERKKIVINKKDIKYVNGLAMLRKVQVEEQVEYLKKVEEKFKNENPYSLGKIIAAGRAGIPESGKWGVVNENLNVVVPFIYDEMYSWGRNEMIVARKGSKWVCIDEQGGMLVPCEMDCCDSLDVNFVTMKKDGKAGVVSKNGIIVPFEYDKIFTVESYNIKRGICPVKDGKVGLMDMHGKSIFTCEFDEVKRDEIYCNFIRIRKNGKWGCYHWDKRQWIIPAQYDEIGEFSSDMDLVGASKDGKWGYITLKGQEVIPLKYDYVTPFSEEKAIVFKDGRLEVIDRKGSLQWCMKIQIPLEDAIKNICPYRNGVMKYRWQYNDETGQSLTVKKNSIFNFTQKGFTFPFDSFECGTKKCGYLASEGLQPIKENGKWGYINKSKKFVIEPIYDWAGYFKNNCAEVIHDSKRIKIDRKGNIVS